MAQAVRWGTKGWPSWGTLDQSPSEGGLHRGRYSAPHAAMVSAFQLAGTASFVQAVRVDRAARLGLRGGTFPKTVS